MPAYETDNEQIELLKRWWENYGKWVIFAVVLGVALGFGWRYWQKQQIDQRQQASLLYQQLVQADIQKKNEPVLQLSTEISKRYPHSTYAVLANLMAAKTAVDQNNNDMAVQKLQWVIEHSKNASIRQIARLRKSRVLLAQNKPDEALKLLSTVDDKVFQPAVDEVMGDIYLAQGNYDKARQAYQSAQSSTLGDDPLLAIKLSGLSQ